MKNVSDSLGAREKSMGCESFVTVGRICLFVVLITAGSGCEKEPDAAGQTGSDSDTEALGDTITDPEGGSETAGDSGGIGCLVFDFRVNC